MWKGETPTGRAPIGQERASPLWVERDPVTGARVLCWGLEMGILVGILWSGCGNALHRAALEMQKGGITALLSKALF